MVAFLNKEPWFPDPRTYNRYLKDGLIAVGGDLSVRRLELAYRMGIFPWTDNPLTWW
ncbi:MAG: leucyl/phenylalanyl-tRNA--protein transferase, partial [Verrucomicrobiota bacterium]